MSFRIYFGISSRTHQLEMLKQVQHDKIIRSRGNQTLSLNPSSLGEGNKKITMREGKPLILTFPPQGEGTITKHHSSPRGGWERGQSPLNKTNKTQQT